MNLSSELIREFAKITNDNDRATDKATIAYGTVVSTGETNYVQLDGASDNTPVFLTMGAEYGDRVMVTIRNHSAIVTGNLSHPAPSGGSFTSFKNLAVENFEAVNARIQNLGVEVLNATLANIEMAYIKTADIETLMAEKGYIKSLDVDNLVAEKGYIKRLEADQLFADYAEIIDADIENLHADVSRIDNAFISHEEVDTLLAGYADVKLLNVDQETVKTLFARTSILDNATIKDGYITGELKGVTISASQLTAGTLDASYITVTNLNADNITTGSINGNRIKENSITLDQLNPSIPKDITEAAIDGINVGSRNLIRNSKTLIFKDYRFQYGDQLAVVDSAIVGYSVITSDVESVIPYSLPYNDEPMERMNVNNNNDDVYNSTNWITGDIITAERLNNIETGIERLFEITHAIPYSIDNDYKLVRDENE